MKNSILSIGIFAVLGFACCKKDDKKVSQVVTVSAPTISFTGSRFYSIPVGGAIPTIAATAYDSVIGESYPVSYDVSNIDNTTPGLYVVVFNTKNKYGYTSQDVAYVAVTNIAAGLNLSGTYKRTSNNEPVHVTEVANGLYETDDVGGAATLEVPAYFVTINETTIELPEQPTIAGDLYAVNGSLHLAAGDTTFTYAIRNASFGTAARTFKKQ